MADPCNKFDDDKDTSFTSNNHNNNSFKLARNLSIPANFKLKRKLVVCKQLTSSNASINDTHCRNKDKTKIMNASLIISKDDSHLTSNNLINKLDMERRHSDRHLSAAREARQTNLMANSAHKLVSPSTEEKHGHDTDGKPISVSISSSLRASDSAFSQSQSTLGSTGSNDESSDRRSSSSFSRSLNELTKDNGSNSSRIIIINDNDNDNNINNHIRNSGSSSSTASNSSGSNHSNRLLINKKGKQHQQQQQQQQQKLDINLFEDDETNSKKQDGFKMIWRNLTFRVPEKKFSQLNAYLDRCKFPVWSANNDQIDQQKTQNEFCMNDSSNDLTQQRQQRQLEHSANSIDIGHHQDCLNSSSSTSTSSQLNDNCDRSTINSCNIPFSGIPRKVIFDNLNGCAESGKLTAILGPSGAGKTTLLNCLTASLVKGVSGSILINDCKDFAETKRKRLKLCIIPQKDYLFDKLTVMENLLFASRLKNTEANFEHQANVQRVTNLLGLQSCLQLKTGKLSGGQYKRVSIAQELLSKPDILILDEPTSGLDSLTCYRTVSVLCDLVNMSRAGLIKPLAIIMTIHQPQMKVFNLFHHVYIMSSLGDCIYEGRPDELIDTVAHCCKLLPPPDDLNPASFIIDLASQVYGPEPMDKLSALQKEHFSAYYGEKNTRISSDDSDCNKMLINKTSTMGDKTMILHEDDHDKKINNSDIIIDDHDDGHDDRSNNDASLNCRKINNNLQDCQLAIFMGDKRIELEPKLMNSKKHCDIHENNQGTKSSVDNNRKSYSLDDRSYSIQNQYKDRIQSDRLIVSDCLRRCNNHDRCFWLHTWLLVNRLWVAMWRDPLLATTRITFHLLIPFVFYFIYSQKSGEANACPLVERELDIHTMTSEETLQRLQVQHNELILTFENVSLFFLLLYSFSMCVLAITALSFPLNMQILLKETSNGWYSMSRFVMAKTIADLPMELTMPIISVSIAYFLTGQPSSYLSWRMLTITAVMTLCSLISQTQGLLFGAYFMNNVQAAVFISQASSLPWIMLSGFTTRVIELPAILRWLSFGSIYRLGIESIVAARYGFGMCPCDKELVDDKPTKLVGISDQLRSVMRYYFEIYADQPQDSATNQVTNNKTSNATSSDDILERLASTISRANTYGAEIVTCHDVKPFIMSARGVEETTLPKFVLILVVIFVALKILLFFVVRLRAGR